MIEGMAYVIALTRRTPRLAQVELLRMAMVCGCALALILAKAPLPF